MVHSSTGTAAAATPPRPFRILAPIEAYRFGRRDPVVMQWIDRFTARCGMFGVSGEAVQAYLDAGPAQPRPPRSYPRPVLARLTQTAAEHGDTIEDEALAALGRLIVRSIHAALNADPALASEFRSAVIHHDRKAQPNGRANGRTHPAMQPVMLGGAR